MKSAITIKVTMWGTTVGYLHQTGNGAASFQYDADFLGSGMQISPLRMPLSQASYSFPNLPEATFHGLPGLVADSLPDKFGTTLLKNYLANLGKDAAEMSAAERLCYTGSRGMGALEYQPAYEVAQTTDQPASITELAKVAEALLSKDAARVLKDRVGLVSQLMESSSSVGGARAKTLVAINPETGEVKSGKIDAGRGFQHWLLKFGSIKNNADKDAEPDEDGYTRVEYAYSLMAKAAGIHMTECQLRMEEGCAHFMTRRFDRKHDTGEKLHMQTLCALDHMDFNTPRVYSYEDAFGVLRRLGLGYDATLELFRRMVFNDLAKNFDDHTKNISFLMDKTGAWSLAPAYDLTFSYKRSSQWVSSHQMLISGKSDDITPDDLRAVAKTAGIRKADANRIIDQVTTSVSGWKAYAEAAGVPERKATGIAALLKV